ncbi:MAG: tetratricopeptide repeat protein [Gemmatimonadaceae bacterium]|nr:tetratricopeptide repeat protein [Gemmatimonadaceae bacterium]
MSAATLKLRKKATDFEQKKQYQKALETYLQLIESARGTEEEKDASLYNRVGDLHLRLGNVEDAVNQYERAVDMYAEGGFPNNAIALCNKIIRHAPNRNAVYYKLGRISATKGFNSDAKKNFLEYADRMQRSGKMDEAFRALEEFADLCPGQDDIRLMLAEQLSRANRKPEALEQLQRLHETLESEGRRIEAIATIERMRAIDPDVTPRTLQTPREKKTDGLVFLDVSFGDDDLPPAPLPPAPAHVLGLEPTSLADDEPVAPPSTGESAVEGLASARRPEPTVEFEPVREAAQPEMSEPVMTPLVADPPSIDLPFLLDDGPDTPDAPAQPPRAFTVDTEEPEFVDLGEWLREEDETKSSRMVAHDDRRVGDEQADFSDMLAKFKQGVAANIEAEDFDSHYDLGVAYREMGLIDEAIAEFQKAVRGHNQRVRAYEAIGQSFIDKEQYAVAHSVLLRALKDPETSASSAGEQATIGINYLLGVSCENLQRYSEAASYYQKVLADDIGFRDVLERLSAVTELAR